MRSTIFTSLMTNYNVLKVSTILQFLIIILLSRIVYCKTPILSAQIHLLTFEQDKTKDKTKANQTKQDQRPKTKPNKTRPKTKLLCFNNFKLQEETITSRRNND